MYHKNELSLKTSIELLIYVMLLTSACSIPYFVLKHYGMMNQSYAIEIVGFIAFFTSAVIIFRLTITKLKALAATRMSLWAYPLLILLTFCFVMLEELIARYITFPNWHQGLYKQILQYKGLYFVFIGIAAPVIEEIIFRGVILRRMSYKYPQWLALLYSSLLFSAFHLNPSQSFAAFFLGLLMGWAYLRFKNILAPIVIHAANNILVWWLVIRPGMVNQKSIYELFPSANVFFLTAAIALIVLVAGIFLMNKMTRQNTFQDDSPNPSPALLGEASDPS